MGVEVAEFEAFGPRPGPLFGRIGVFTMASESTISMTGLIRGTMSLRQSRWSLASSRS